MKHVLFILLILFLCGYASAQDSTAQSCPPKVKIPQTYISTDAVYDVESIPNICFEHFFLANNKFRSWQIDAAYQIHYNDQFGIATSHGDRISVGVYQGPAVRAAYDVYRRKRRKHWSSYYAPGLGFKYLWYSDVRVNTGRKSTDLAYRVQSEHCFATIPQLVTGLKHVRRHFCADFYIGLQLPVKMRYISVTEEQNAQGMGNPHVPYNTDPVMVSIAPVLGIKLGYIK